MRHKATVDIERLLRPADDLMDQAEAEEVVGLLLLLFVRPTEDIRCPAIVIGPQRPYRRFAFPAGDFDRVDVGRPNRRDAADEFPRRTLDELADEMIDGVKVGRIDAPAEEKLRPGPVALLKDRRREADDRLPSPCVASESKGQEA